MIGTAPALEYDGAEGPGVSSYAESDKKFMSEITLETEQAVLERYASASAKKEEALCCAVDYDPKYLEVIPDEILERDYGCGDPSQYVACLLYTSPSPRD